MIKENSDKKSIGVTVDLPPKLWEKLDQLAKGKGTTKKSLVISWITPHLTGSPELWSGEVTTLKAEIETLHSQMSEKQQLLDQALNSLTMSQDATMKAQQLNAHDKQQLSIYQQALAEATKPKNLLQRLISVVVPERLPAIEVVKPDGYVSPVISPLSAVPSEGDGG